MSQPNTYSDAEYSTASSSSYSHGSKNPMAPKQDRSEPQPYAGSGTTANGTTTTDLEKSQPDLPPQQQQPPPEHGTGLDLENNHDEVLDYNGIPAGQDELTRYESNAALSQRLSRRMTGSEKLMEEASNTNEPLPPMGGGRDYPPPLPDRTPYMVAYDGPDDPLHPHNWHVGRKMTVALIVGLSAFSVSLGSAMFSEAAPVIEEKFHIGPTVATLGTSLFVFGFASGPIIWGPMSELYGRRIVQLVSGLGYICFSFAVGSAKDLQTIMICRFFAGFVGAAPLVVAPAIMADTFGAAKRGQAMTIFAMVLFGGPMLAPILGAFTTKNSALGWRWTSYFCGLIGALSLILMVFFLQETHHGIILVQKAEKLRRRTGNWGISAPHEEFSLSFKEIAEKNIMRPLVMLTEPILFLITLYNAFIYGIIYLCLTAVPYIYQVNYGWTTGVAELPYISMLIGIFIGAMVGIVLEGRFNRKMQENGGKPIPEERLVPMILGGPMFAIGLFWVGWTGDYPEHVSPWVSIVGVAFIGFGLLTIFLPCINYIIDCYLFYAASAMAANTLLRSAFGGAFPLFARPMILNLTVKWAMTLLGCIAVVMIPVPVLFYKYGPLVRKKSKYSIEM